jgi:hypothetical protein
MLSEGVAGTNLFGRGTRQKKVYHSNKKANDVLDRVRIWTLVRVLKTHNRTEIWKHENNTELGLLEKRGRVFIWNACDPRRTHELLCNDGFDACFGHLNTQKNGPKEIFNSEQKKDIAANFYNRQAAVDQSLDSFAQGESGRCGVHKDTIKRVVRAMSVETKRRHVPAQMNVKKATKRILYCTEATKNGSDHWIAHWAGQDESSVHTHGRALAKRKDWMPDPAQWDQLNDLEFVERAKDLSDSEIDSENDLLVPSSLPPPAKRRKVLKLAPTARSHSKNDKGTRIDFSIAVTAYKKVQLYVFGSIGKDKRYTKNVASAPDVYHALTGISEQRGIDGKLYLVYLKELSDKARRMVRRKELPKGLLWTIDNAPSHTEATVIQWLKEPSKKEKIKTVGFGGRNMKTSLRLKAGVPGWPGDSPDLHAIEMLIKWVKTRTYHNYYTLKFKMRHEKQRVSDAIQLYRSLHQAWDELPERYLYNCCVKTYRLMEQCIEVVGGYGLEIK